jgi:hypothetical protein
MVDMATLLVVTAGLDPTIHPLGHKMDPRVEPGGDDVAALKKHHKTPAG